MGHFLPFATISITGYKLATSFLKDIIYFCPFLKMEGAFSYCNDHIMAVSEKEERNPNQLCGSHKQKHQGFLLPKHLQLLSPADLEHL